MDTGTESRLPQESCCFNRTFSTLTVDDVYEIAKLVGAEVEKLIDGYGKESVEGLVPKIVKVLELLESFVSGNQSLCLREEELLKTFEQIQLQQQKKRWGKDGEEGYEKNEIRELQQKEEQWERRCEELQARLQKLQDDKKELKSRLEGTYAQEDRAQRQEREVMLKLKGVVDKQRDELRAKVQEIATVSKEVEALQEQLDRFMKMNEELRHKQNVLQTQLKSMVERKADVETDLKEKNKEIERLQRQLNKANAQLNKADGNSSLPSPSQTAKESAEKPTVEQNDFDQPCFTKKEVRDILFERNELKTNLFLVQEELSYYQREILNEERCPGFLLEAVRSAIKERRKLIKAKMLGIPLSDCSISDKEETGSLNGQTEVDHSEVDGPSKPAESRIRHLFGFLTRAGSIRNPTHMSNSASSWEILGETEASEETEPQPTS
ncbi:RILP-like protein 1 [Poecilia latipinna]|uniref:RILP-like protein 2 n=2 Tax=Poecilia TaxID=8080 RepID=A0A087XM84_POEFO|nr:PREDICTED: rab-interacting lysosomal protein [Poecilia formosa]XP_014888997.1 PREDICTED: RILP-like protein 1 [Poecilia latipinna]